MRKLVLLFLALGLTLASCDKEDNTYDPIDVSKAKLLINGVWQLKSYTYNPNIDDEESVLADLFTEIPGCVKDNLHFFRPTGTFVMEEGYTKCIMTAPDSVEYFYRLEENENRIIVWADPEDEENSILMYGKLECPSIDTFIYSYQVYDEELKINSEHKQVFVNIPLPL